METKKYSSYSQIESELEILKVEREISLQKMGLSLQKTKESFLPTNIIKVFLGDYKSIFFNYSGTLLKMAIPFFINWFLNKKRGN